MTRLGAHPLDVTASAGSASRPGPGAEDGGRRGWTGVQAENGRGLPPPGPGVENSKVAAAEHYHSGLSCPVPTPALPFSSPVIAQKFPAPPPPEPHACCLLQAHLHCLSWALGQAAQDSRLGGRALEATALAQPLWVPAHSQWWPIEASGEKILVLNSRYREIIKSPRS